MRAKAFLLVSLLACLTMVFSAFAQEGHPLKGTWLGDWGPNKNDRNQVTIVMDWDGKQITGQVNPGPNSIPISKATLEPKGWIVHFEADAKNAAGKPEKSGSGKGGSVEKGIWTGEALFGNFVVNLEKRVFAGGV